MATPTAAAFLDKLSEKQRSIIKKEGWDRLAGRMRKIGKTETEINAMTRAQMMEIYAEVVIKGKGEVEEEVAAAVEGKPIYIMDTVEEKLKGKKSEAEREARE